MSSMRALQLPASPTGFGLPGCWTLGRDRAVRLGAQQPGWLRVSHGAIWATLDGPHPQGVANQWGDVVLRCGARIRLTPGRHVVLESYSAAANEDACFSWEPDVDDAAPTVRASASRAAWRLVNWLGTGWRGAMRWVTALDRGVPMTPDVFADARTRAARKLLFLARNQP